MQINGEEEPCMDGSTLLVTYKGVIKIISKYRVLQSTTHISICLAIQLIFFRILKAIIEAIGAVTVVNLVFAIIVSIIFTVTVASNSVSKPIELLTVRFILTKLEHTLITEKDSFEADPYCAVLLIRYMLTAYNLKISRTNEYLKVLEVFQSPKMDSIQNLLSKLDDCAKSRNSVKLNEREIELIIKGY